MDYNQFPVLRYRKRKSTSTDDPTTLAAEIQNQLQLIAWEDYVMSGNIEKLTLIRNVAIFTNSGKDRIPADHLPGRIYHMFLQTGLLEHISGFDNLRHFIKLPLSWKAQTYHTEVVDAYTDEEGVEHPAETIIETNGEHYSLGMVENDTHCLVKITDANYQELKSLINTEIGTENIIAEDKYDEAIAEGGDFYNPPQTTKEPI